MKSALVLIDIQNDYFKNGKNELYRPENAALNAKQALEFCRNNGIPVFHVKHISVQNGATYFLPETLGVEINDAVAPLPTEMVIIKNTPNSFYQTELASELADRGINHIIFCGMMSHMCIDTTVRAARFLGFTATVLHDACTTRDLAWGDRVIPALTTHETIMASLQGTFAEVISTDEFINNFKVGL